MDKYQRERIYPNKAARQFLNEGNIKQINPSVTIMAANAAKANAKESKTKSRTQAVTVILQ